MNFRAKYTAQEPCQHCGRWHHGRSEVSQDLAETMATHDVMICGNTRRILGLADAGMPHHTPTGCVVQTGYAI